MRKRILFLLMAMVLVALCFKREPVLARTEKDTLSREIYEKYVQQGVISESIKYEEWRFLVEKSKELEDALSKSPYFNEVYSSENNRVQQNFLPARGDIVITNGTSSAGIFGHSGIAVSAYNILHIAGFGCVPELITFGSWNNTYSYVNEDSWTKVYRCTDSSVANAAATWAEDNYLDSFCIYMIDEELFGTFFTYCSKIVWQAYAFGPSSPAAYVPGWSGIVLPYELPNLIYNCHLEHVY
ncbi:MAG: hypothetical protein K6F93_04925 [Lachnospiraceae bacterium]|nr:hypothetical protein [Lachnospiraceae bacterium]